jgi:hypothetical protein
MKWNLCCDAAESRKVVSPVGERCASPCITHSKSTKLEIHDLPLNPEDTAGLWANEGGGLFVCATDYEHGKLRLRVETHLRRHLTGPPRGG